MRVLLVHQNMPGQFGALARRLAAEPDVEVATLGKAEWNLPGALRARYPEPPAPGDGAHRWLRTTESAVRHGQAAARACVGLRQRGFAPDVVVGHPGWGETLYVKDVFPRARLLSYCEFFYRSSGADVGFDPAEPVDLDGACRLRTRAAHLLLGLDAMDAGLAPTEWQRSVHPAAYRPSIEVIHDGIDCALARPDPEATFELPDGTALRAGDEVVTYVARDLEPYRGFPTFMRALPRILEARPAARVAIVGGDGVSYGRAAPTGRSWREEMAREIGGLDPARVAFLGRIPYDMHLRLLRVSAVHVYLTVPFVLSWSVLEAMASGCVVVGSDTPPVREVVEDGRNGLLVDFFDPEGLARQVAGALAARDGMGALRRQARETILDRYRLEACVERRVELVRRLAEAR